VSGTGSGRGHVLPTGRLADLPEARWLTPQLTTVRQPVREMAAEAVRVLLRRRARDPLEPARIELSTSLVLRDSTAPPPPRDVIGVTSHT
jgi:hypothetical protein